MLAVTRENEGEPGILGPKENSFEMSLMSDAHGGCGAIEALPKGLGEQIVCKHSKSEAVTVAGRRQTQWERLLFDETVS